MSKARLVGSIRNGCCCCSLLPLSSLSVIELRIKSKVSSSGGSSLSLKTKTKTTNQKLHMFIVNAYNSLKGFTKSNDEIQDNLNIFYFNTVEYLKLTFELKYSKLSLFLSSFSLRSSSRLAFQSLKHIVSRKRRRRLNDSYCCLIFMILSEYCLLISKLWQCWNESV